MYLLATLIGADTHKSYILCTDQTYISSRHRQHLFSDFQCGVVFETEYKYVEFCFSNILFLVFSRVLSLQWWIIARIYFVRDNWETYFSAHFIMYAQFWWNVWSGWEQLFVARRRGLRFFVFRRLPSPLLLPSSLFPFCPSNLGLFGAPLQTPAPERRS